MLHTSDPSDSIMAKEETPEKQADRFILTCSVLVVVGGFLLYCLLAPIYKSSKPKATSTSCLSNMKQLGLALLMYVQDYDEKFPPAAEWMDMTLPYLKNENTYRCPGVAEKDKFAYGYGFNRKLERTLYEKIAEPEKTIMLFESWNLKKNVSDSVLTLLESPRHNDTINLAYADGHASRLDRSQRSGIITPITPGHPERK
jgi:prepilin-type processing-associated H-X9-DG protein